MTKTKPKSRRGPKPPRRSQPPPRPRRTAARGLIPQSGAPAWARAVMEPFSTPPGPIPDQLAAPTMKAKSLSNLSFSPTDVANSNQHGCLILIQPRPASAVITARMGWSSALNAFVNSSNLEDKVPNYTALFPTTGVSAESVTTDDYRFRCTAMGVRLTYTGTELNRGGQVVIGLIEPDMSGNANDAWWMAFGNSGLNLSTVLTRDTVLKRMTRYKVFREWDSTLEFESIPSGCPLYEQLTFSNGANYPTPLTLNAINPMPLLCVMILGDTTTNPGATGNTFDMEVMRHWEILSPSDLVTSIPMTPSPYNARELEYCLNVFGAAYADFPVKSLDNSRGLATSNPTGYQQMRKNAAYAAASAATVYAGYRLYQHYQASKQTKRSFFG